MGNEKTEFCKRSGVERYTLETHLGGKLFDGSLAPLESFDEDDEESPPLPLAPGLSSFFLASFLSDDSGTNFFHVLMRDLARATTSSSPLLFLRGKRNQHEVVMN